MQGVSVQTDAMKGGGMQHGVMQGDEQPASTMQGGGMHNGTTVAYEVYLSVSSDNPHTVVEGQAIDPIEFHDPYQSGATRWAVSPPLPDGLSMDPATGEVTGSVDGELANTVYTVTAIGDSPTDSGDGSGHHISPASNYAKIDAGPSHTCAIDVNGDLRCWGSDARGQLVVDLPVAHVPYDLCRADDAGASGQRAPTGGAR